MVENKQDETYAWIIIYEQTKLPALFMKIQTCPIVLDRPRPSQLTQKNWRYWILKKKKKKKRSVWCRLKTRKAGRKAVKWQKKRNTPAGVGGGIDIVPP